MPVVMHGIFLHQTGPANRHFGQTLSRFTALDEQKKDLAEHVIQDDGLEGRPLPGESRQGQIESGMGWTGRLEIMLQEGCQLVCLTCLVWLSLGRSPIRSRLWRPPSRPSARAAIVES